MNYLDSHSFHLNFHAMKKTWIALIVLAVTAFSACAPKNNSGETAGSQPLVGTQWKLVELFGKPVSEADTNKEGFLLLQKDGRFSASAGCNTLLGGYELKEPMGITFQSNMASTMMACPNSEPEENLKKVLSETNAYQLAGNKLSLSKNKMAPFARFEASIKPK